MRVFITYGDTGYEAAKTKVVKEAHNTCEFEKIYAYGRQDLSDELLNSEVIKIKRGGGLWSWKPDIILTTMEKHKEGDIIVYCDAGCSLYSSSEWHCYWKKLQKHDIIVQRIYQRTDHWTRIELLDVFNNNIDNWHKCYQYLATVVILKISRTTKEFVRQWRDLMITNPMCVSDVAENEFPVQKQCFKENRHDQALYSSLVYKYLSNPVTKDRFYTQWEHIEDLDPFRKQAIRATRLRKGEKETSSHKFFSAIKRIIKDYCFRPFYYGPLQWWYSRILRRSRQKYDF